jgi:hypothetical protein
MRAAASGGGWCCRRESWLLKYMMCVIFNPQSAHIVSTFLCTLYVLCGFKMKTELNKSGFLLFKDKIPIWKF